MSDEKRAKIERNRRELEALADSDLPIAAVAKAILAVET